MSFIVVNMLGKILALVGLDEELSNILAETADRTVKELSVVLEVVNNEDSPF